MMRNLLHKGTRLTYCIGSIAAMGGFLFGYHTGSISTLMTMPSFNQTFLINNDTQSEQWTSIINASIVASLSFGCIIGALLAGPLSDRFSRKYAIFCASMIFMLGIILQGSAVHLPMLFIGRVITGASIGTLSTVVPVYQAEIASGTRRGRIVSLHQVAVTLGIATGFWLNHAMINHLTGNIQWRLSFGIQVFPALILCIGIYFCPFSPHWLISQHRTDEAQVVFQQIRDGDVSQSNEELESIQAEFSLEQGTVKKSYMRLVTDPLRRRLILAIGIQLMSQLSGINSIMYYAPKIFTAIIPNSENNTVTIITGISGIVNVLATIPTFVFIDRLGRRILLMSGAIIMAISMVITGALIGSFGKTDVDVEIDDRPVLGVIILGIYIFVAAFASTWGPISWLYPTEIFPLGLRAKATSISAACNWLSNCALAFLVPFLLNSLWYGTYIIFGTLCIMMGMIVYLFFPETKGINAENIDEIFDRSICVRSVRWLNPSTINRSD